MIDRREQLFWRLGFLALAMAAAFPIWWVHHLPLQDLPQHLAAIRVLHDYDDAALGFARYFDVDIWRTQYLAYYFAADFLCWFVDVETANRLLITGFIVGMPYAMASLLSAQGRDPRFALFVLPLTYNAHLILGFFNFLAAIPLSLIGIALAIRQRRQPSRRRSLWIGAVAAVCFYTHVVPFAFLCLGIVLVSLGRDLRATLGRLLPLGPALLAAVHWSFASPAGQATATAAAGATSGPRPSYQTAARALSDLPVWLTDVLGGDTDRQLLWAWVALAAVCFALGLLRGRSGPDRLGVAMTWRLLPLAPAAAVAYFVAPTGYDWIWPIAQRFPLLAAIYFIAAMPQPPKALATTTLIGAVLISSWHFHIAGSAFADFDRDEVGEFDRAVDHIPDGQRVAGLIFKRHSRHVSFSPFIHYVALVQARKGGAVMFSFADFPQSPFRFKEANRPPRVGPRWEWMPQRVQPDRDLDWFSYVLVRGGPGAIARSDRYEAVHRGPHWSVWRRTR